MPPRRWIAHLDMDAFYASVELLRYPELKGLPVVIGGGRRHQPERLADGSRRFATLDGYTGRGVITTATYPARDLGVHSGMGLMKAALRAPQAVLLPVDFEQYRAYSRRFKAAVAEIAPVIEDRGIDEIYIDLSEHPGAQDAVAHDPYGGVRAIARDLKNNVRDATGLSCSVGVTPNKLLSKIASDLDKPDGLTLLTLDDLPERIWPLPARRINGIGPKAAATLAGYAGRGVVTTATYAARDFGVHSGMGLMKAAALAPQAVLLPVDFEQYRRYSRMFKAAVAEVAPVIEDRGIDEIYIDLTDVPGAQDSVGTTPSAACAPSPRRSATTCAAPPA